MRLAACCLALTACRFSDPGESAAEGPPGAEPAIRRYVEPEPVVELLDEESAP